MAIMDAALQPSAVKRGERAPPGHDDGESAARADLIAQPSAGDLEQRVGHLEAGKNPAHGHQVESPDPSGWTGAAMDITPRSMYVIM